MKLQLVDFIKNNHDWKDILKKKYKILIREQGPYTLFMYTKGSVYKIPLVQECRGIILDMNEIKPVCWSFNKFGELGEPYVPEIDWSTARVLDKVDGSIIKLWWSEIENRWIFSTNKCIYAELAYSLYRDKSMLDVIKSADNYSDIDFNSLNKLCTYTFELVDPVCQIIIKYNKTHLYHIGTRDLSTGDEINDYIGVEKPREFDLKSLNECIDYVNSQTTFSDNKTRMVDMEGVVVVDANFNRLKIKSINWKNIHLFADDKLMIEKNKIIAVDLLRKGVIDVNSVCTSLPRVAPIMKYYDYKVTEVRNDLIKFCSMARVRFQELGYDRKALAELISKHRYSGVAFYFLKRDDSVAAEEYVDSLESRTFARLIPDYKSMPVGEVFYPYTDGYEGEEV